MLVVMVIMPVIHVIVLMETKAVIRIRTVMAATYLSFSILVVMAIGNS